MRLLHYLELRNFKRFGKTQRIELDHPAVLIGPNNSGKTTAVQALALWSHAVKTWVAAKGQSPPKQRLRTVYWQRYEVENYLVTPQALLAFASNAYEDFALFGRFRTEVSEVCDGLVMTRVFDGRQDDFATWQSLPASQARLVWDARTERLKLSDFAEEFFRQLAGRLGHPMLLRKGQLHRLARFVEPVSIPSEVAEKLDLLEGLFTGEPPGDRRRAT